MGHDLRRDPRAKRRLELGSSVPFPFPLPLPLPSDHLPTRQEGTQL
jgi:hypothetical protein